mgnify:FL=1
MNTQTWIKRSEREPTEADMPGQFGYYTPSGVWSRWADEALPGKHNLYTHWRSIKCAPPARELTQRERDEETIGNIVVSYRYSGPTRQVAEAIDAERREVCALLNQLWAHDWGAKSGLSPVRELRARLDEQGAK